MTCFCGSAKYSQMAEQMHLLFLCLCQMCTVQYINQNMNLMCFVSEMKKICVCVSRISLDEGRQWDKLSFSSTPLFVDGVLMTPETENRIIT